jgi:hypothetical protein
MTPAAVPRAFPPAMLGTRVLTALILIPLVLAALFLLPPLGWGTAALAAIAVAAVEWARLAGFGRRAQSLFAAGVVAIGRPRCSCRQPASAMAGGRRPCWLLSAHRRSRSGCCWRPSGCATTSARVPAPRWRSSERSS